MFLLKIFNLDIIKFASMLTYYFMQIIQWFFSELLQNIPIAYLIGINQSNAVPVIFYENWLRYLLFYAYHGLALFRT